MHCPLFTSLPQKNTFYLPNAPTMRWAVHVGSHFGFRVFKEDQVQYRFFLKKHHSMGPNITRLPAQFDSCLFFLLIKFEQGNVHKETNKCQCYPFTYVSPSKTKKNLFFLFHMLLNVSQFLVYWGGKQKEKNHLSPFLAYAKLSKLTFVSFFFLSFSCL